MSISTHPPESAFHEETRRRRHGRRVRQFTGLFAGAAVGFTAGLVLQWAIGLTRITGHADNPFSVIFGLPVAMAIAFGLFGLLLATTREVAVVDAPVRVRWFRGLGRAATSTRGQLPGSSVPPGTTGDEEQTGPAGPAGSDPPRAGIGA